MISKRALRNPRRDAVGLAHQRLQQTELTSPADMSKLEAAQAEITPEMNGAEVKAVYRKHGL